MEGLSHPIIEEDANKVASAPLPWEELRNATVLITGAAGMAASFLLYTLLRLNDTRGLGVKVIALERSAERSKMKLGKLLERPDVELYTQDVCAPLQYGGPADFIIHAASLANPKFFATDPVGTLNANALGTVNLLEVARQRGSRGFLFFSSSEVYGMAGGGALLKEDEPGMLASAATRACYPESKRVAETYCAAYASQYGLPCRIARIAHMFGPSMDRDDGHAIAEFMRCALDGRDIVLKSDGTAERAYVYVADVAAGLFTMLLKGQDLVYNLTNEANTVSVKTLAQLMTEVYPEKKLKVVFDIPPAAANTGFLSYRLGFLDSGRLRGLSWAPAVPLAEGIRRTISVFE